MVDVIGRAPAGIHQILVAASPGDAVTNLALEMRELLRRAGPSEIYAHHIAPALAHEARPLASYVSRHSRSVLVYHASIGEPHVHEFLTDHDETLVLVYHNVTPAHYFRRLDPAFADLLALGRRELDVLRPRVARAIAVSEYNAAELRAMGYCDVRIVPPILDVARLSKQEPRASTVTHLRSLGGPVLLCVGQLMPHKRQDFLVEALHVADTYLGARPFLMLVGHQRLERYARAIREQVRELNLVRVHLVGSVDGPDLAAMFHCATAVVTASEHEGFCLPLVEAMTLGKPVLARACAAIPETVGRAGLLVSPRDAPTVFAEAMTELLFNPSLEQELRSRGRRRVAELADATTGAGLLEALLEAV